MAKKKSHHMLWWIGGGTVAAFLLFKYMGNSSAKTPILNANNYPPGFGPGADGTVDVPALNYDASPSGYSSYSGISDNPNPYPYANLDPWTGPAPHTQWLPAADNDSIAPHTWEPPPSGGSLPRPHPPVFLR